jgi:hypothetical protein
MIIDPQSSPVYFPAGTILFLQSGATLSVQSGATIAPQVGGQAAPIANVPTGGSATAAADADAINSILAALRAVGIIAGS